MKCIRQKKHIQERRANQVLEEQKLPIKFIIVYYEMKKSILLN